MKNLQVLFLGVFAALIMSACATTVNKNFGSAALDIELQTKLAAEVEVDMSKKISGTATFKKILIFTITEPENFADGVTYSAAGASGNSSGGILSFLGSGGGPVEQVKSAAAYNAIMSGKADFIAAPTYIVKSSKNLFSSEVVVQVSGYAGKLKNIKPVTAAQ